MIVRWVIFVMLLSLAGCRKDPEIFNYGEVSVLRNGVKFEGKLENGCCDPKDPLGFGFWQTYQKGGYIEIYNLVADRILGKQILKNCDSFRDSSCRSTGRFITVMDYDAGGDDYAINDSSSTENFIEITSEVNNFKEIWGNFQFEAVRLYKDPESKLPDTLRFAQGTFHLYFK
jgi:hypothetical protein